MELEQQVCSQELASRLKTLGVKQESYFYWYCGKVLRANQLTQELRRGAPPVSALTVAELGELLPRNFISWRDSVVGRQWWLCDDRTKGPTDTYAMANTEADARAKMLVYLFENGLMDVDTNGGGHVLEEEKVAC